MLESFTVSQIRCPGKTKRNVYAYPFVFNSLECSRLVWGVRGYAITLVCQIGMATCYYGIQIVYGYFVSFLFRRQGGTLNFHFGRKSQVCESGHRSNGAELHHHAKYPQRRHTDERFHMPRGLRRHQCHTSSIWHWFLALPWQIWSGTYAHHLRNDSCGMLP